VKEDPRRKRIEEKGGNGKKSIKRRQNKASRKSYRNLQQL